MSGRIEQYSLYAWRGGYYGAASDAYMNTTQAYAQFIDSHRL